MLLPPFIGPTAEVCAARTVAFVLEFALHVPLSADEIHRSAMRGYGSRNK